MKNRNFRSMTAIMVMVVLCFAVIAAVNGSVAKGRKAPGFKLQSLSGKYVTLDDLLKGSPKARNKVVVMDFWATWCPPCREETAVLQKLHEEYASKGVAVVGISVDRGGWNDIRPFVKEHKLTYTVLADPDNKVAGPLYAVRGIPDTYILDNNGVVRFHYSGSFPGMDKQLEKDLQSLLK
ncbi:MAG TPA: TlpA disulfide reductase family protein [Armatimonadota bacterium]